MGDAEHVPPRTEDVDIDPDDRTPAERMVRVSLELPDGRYLLSYRHADTANHA